MCQIANGAAEAYFEFGIHIWDMAAGMLIVQESGGVVLDPSGAELNLLSRRLLCAANIDVAKALIPLLKSINYEHD